MSRVKLLLTGLVAIAVIASLVPVAMSADPIKVAYIDPLSGTFAATGENGLNQFKFAIERVNRAGGVLGRPARDLDARLLLGGQLELLAGPGGLDHLPAVAGRGRGVDDDRPGRALARRVVVSPPARGRGSKPYSGVREG